jgi:hypothetical protein
MEGKVNMNTHINMSAIVANTEALAIKHGDRNVTFFEYWNELMSDGFQLGDILKTLRFGVRQLCRFIADAVPGFTSEEKVNWVKAQLMLAAEKLIGWARDNFFTGILAFAGYAFEKIATSLAHGAVDWIAANVLEPIIKFAYMDEVLEGGIKSESYKAIVIADANDDLPVFIDTGLLRLA